jgi:uncharacterized protein YecT (DUF1311 family)
MDRQSRLVERAYQAARGRVSATEKRRLAASQRAWKAGVDRKCRSKDLFGPTLLGTDEIDEVLWCLGDEYMERTEWLERRYLKSKPRHPPAR